MLDKITHFAKCFDEVSQQLGKALYHSGKGLTRIGLIGGSGYALYKGYSALSHPLDLKSSHILPSSENSLKNFFFKFIENTQKQLLDTPVDNYTKLLESNMEEIHTILDETHDDISTQLKKAQDRALKKLESSLEKIIRKLETAQPGNQGISSETTNSLHDALEEVEELVNKAFEECDQKLSKTEKTINKFLKQQKQHFDKNSPLSSLKTKEDLDENLKTVKSLLEDAQTKINKAKENVRQKVKDAVKNTRTEMKNAQIEFQQKNSYCPSVYVPVIGEVYKTSLLGTGSGALHLTLWAFFAHPIPLGISGACTIIPLLWSRSRALDDAEKKTKPRE